MALGKGVGGSQLVGALLKVLDEEKQQFVYLFFGSGERGPTRVQLFKNADELLVLFLAVNDLGLNLGDEGGVVERGGCVRAALDELQTAWHE